MKTVIVVLLSLFLFSCKSNRCEPPQQFSAEFKFEFLDKKTSENFFKSQKIKLDSFQIINLNTQKAELLKLDTTSSQSKYFLSLSGEFPDFYINSPANVLDMYDKEICSKFMFYFQRNMTDTLSICLTGTSNRDKNCPSFSYTNIKIKNFNDSIIYIKNNPSNSDIIKIYK